MTFMFEIFIKFYIIMIFPDVRIETMRRTQNTFDFLYYIFSKCIYMYIQNYFFIVGLIFGKLSKILINSLNSIYLIFSFYRIFLDLILIF